MLAALDDRQPTPGKEIIHVSQLLQQVQALVARGEVLVSLHGSEELEADDIRVRDAVNGIAAAVVVEEYPEYVKGPCVLVLEHDDQGRPIPVVWGIPAGQESPAVLVTAYRPNPEKWDETWQRRRNEPQVCEEIGS